MEQKKFLIIGAGIGGLSVAAALRKAGHTFEIFEAAPAMRHGGAGIAVWANALHALRALGMESLPDCFQVGHSPVAIRTSRGEILMQADTSELAARYGALSAVVHREDLHAVLWQLAGKPEILTGKKIESYENLTHGPHHQVCAIFADGTQAEGDALVGCDGAGSQVRKTMLGDQPPRYAGYTAWRGIAHLRLTDPTPGETWGQGQRFGFFPLHDERAYWFATRNCPANSQFPGQMKENLLQWFRGWHDPVVALIENTADAELLRNDIYDRDPVSNWCDGNVIILGDAAHPTTPNLGQGGCMAIEDAVALRKALSAHNDIAAAFAACNAARRKRTAELVRKARRIGAVGQWSFKPAVALRNFLLRHLSQKAQLRELDAVIGYRV
ncbi:MAG: FAD-dependent monooxygenase [Turneriella sp.]